MTREEAIEKLKRWKLDVDDEKEYAEYLEGWFYKDDEIAFNMAIEALSDAPDTNVGKWIPVSERLPEYEEEVLVTRHFLSDNQLKKNAITESFYVEVASRMDDEWTSYSDEYKIKRHLHKVIAWMPLPEPYQENAQLPTEDTTQIFADGMPLEEYLKREWEKQRAYLEEHGIIFRDGGAE